MPHLLKLTRGEGWSMTKYAHGNERLVLKPSRHLVFSSVSPGGFLSGTQTSIQMVRERVRIAYLSLYKTCSTPRRRRLLYHAIKTLSRSNNQFPSLEKHAEYDRQSWISCHGSVSFEDGAQRGRLHRH